MNMVKFERLSFIHRWFYYFGQDQAGVSWMERVRAAFGAFIGLLLTVLLSRFLGGMAGVNEWFMASLGASSLLIFVLPSSPMAQPWAVIAGNVLSATVGITCCRLIGDHLGLAVATSASVSILGMFVLRCLHPPAAAVALIAVMGQVINYRYALFPVLIDSIILCAAGLIYNVLTGKTYPTKPPLLEPCKKSDAELFEEANSKLNAILDDYQEVIDVDRAELIKIIQFATKPRR